MEKKLYRSKTDKKVAGVCAGVVAYVVCALVIPEEPGYIDA